MLEDIVWISEESVSKLCLFCFGLRFHYLLVKLESNLRCLF